MNGLRLHAVLLVLALLVAFQTWVRDVPTNREAVLTLVWERDSTDVAAVTLESDTAVVAIEMRTDEDEPYLWGTEVRGADTLSYPIGIAGWNVVRALADFRVVRELGQPDAASLATYGLESVDERVRIEFATGTRVMELGGTPFGGEDRYARDLETGEVYVVPDAITRPLQLGEGALRERLLHYFQPDQVARVQIQAGGESRSMTRTPGDGGRPPTWSEEADANQSDEAFGNFMARLDQMSITGFSGPPPRDEITGVVRLDYFDAAGDELGFMELYRTTPSDPDETVTYHVLTERTRMLAGAVRTLAERVEQDLVDIF